MFESNETIKDAEINIQLKPGHYPVKQKARPVPLHLQKDVGRELERLIKSGHLEKINNVDEDCFVCVRRSMRREDRETAPDGYKLVFEKLFIRWGLVFVDDQIVVPIDLRRRLLDILHFGHSGTTKMETEAKIFWWPEKKHDIETKVKDCTACLASGKSLKYQLPKKTFRKTRKTNRTRTGTTNRFYGKTTQQKHPRRCTNIDRRR